MSSKPTLPDLRAQLSETRARAEKLALDIPTLKRHASRMAAVGTTHQKQKASAKWTSAVEGLREAEDMIEGFRLEIADREQAERNVKLASGRDRMATLAKERPDAARAVEEAVEALAPKLARFIDLGDEMRQVGGAMKALNPHETDPARFENRNLLGKWIMGQLAAVDPKLTKVTGSIQGSSTEADAETVEAARR